jgi:crotonobetainyl-CoA:carnitine CoA-transferase CaiB-like acyl-CoA transferase
MPQPPRAIEKIRVLELASVLAGPLAGTALSERGARVTIVECPPHGDVARSWKMPNESPEL